MKTHRFQSCRTWGALAAGAVFVISPILLAQEVYRPAAAEGGSMETIDLLDPELQLRISEIERLSREGKHAEAGKLRDALQSEMAGKLMFEQNVRLPEREDSESAQKPDRPPKPMPPRAKIRHLRVAAENLEAAGYCTQAGEIRAEINRIEVELAAPPAELAKVRREMEKLVRELEKLRHEVRKLQEERQESSRPGDGETQEAPERDRGTPR